MWLVSPWAGDRGPYNTLVLSKTFSFFSQVVGFSIGLSPRTIQCLGSVENLCFFFLVIGFPTGLGPRTIQCLGSVQNLCLFSGSWFPHRLKSEYHAMPCFCIKSFVFSKVVGFPIGVSPRTIQWLGPVQDLCLFSGSWFPHRFESENHTMP